MSLQSIAITANPQAHPTARVYCAMNLTIVVPFMLVLPSLYFFYALFDHAIISKFPVNLANQIIPRYHTYGGSDLANSHTRLPDLSSGAGLLRLLVLIRTATLALAFTHQGCLVNAISEISVGNITPKMPRICEGCLQAVSDIQV